MGAEALLLGEKDVWVLGSHICFRAVCSLCPGLAPPSTTPLVFRQREAVVVDHSLGWERNVMYA